MYHCLSLTHTNFIKDSLFKRGLRILIYSESSTQYWPSKFYNHEHIHSHNSYPWSPQETLPLPMSLIEGDRTSLVVQGLWICLPIQGIQVQPLVWEDSTCWRTTKLVSHKHWVLMHPRASALQQEKPLQWEAWAWQLDKVYTAAEDLVQTKINKYYKNKN